MRKGMILGSLAALGLSGPALATDGFNYSFVELGYIDTELDDFDASGDGFGLRGSVELTENVHLFASYSDLDYDFDISGEELRIGAGYAWPLNPRLDIVGRLAYVRAEVDASVTIPGLGRINFGADDSGFGLGAGLRGRPIERLELTGGLDYVDVGDSDDTSFDIGGRYYFTSAFSGGLDLRFNDDGTTYILGGRFDFGAR